MANKRKTPAPLPDAPPSGPAHDKVVRIPEQNPPVATDGDGRRSRIGIVEIARMAGVSTITVSRALRNPDVVSEATRRKILDIVQRTGYVSHPYARALRVGHSSLIVAFVSSMISPQYAIAMQRCADILESHDYQLLTGLTSYSYLKEISGISMLRALQPAAALFTGVIELESNRRSLRELGIPILESWAYPPDPIDMLVGFPNYDCGRMAARYLHDRGCKRLTFIGREGGRGTLRQNGFLDQAAELGLETRPSILLKNIQNLYDGKNVYQSIAHDLTSADGIFCANDILALGIHAEIRHAAPSGGGRPVLAGFGDLGYMARTEPALPVIGMDSALLGEKAAHMILDKLRGQPRALVDHVPVRIYEPPTSA